MNPEQESAEVPVTIEENAADNVAAVRSISVEESADELRRLDDLGPDSEEVKQWMAKHGITENDQIIANGNVYVASAHDFLTRDVAATNEWAASARNIVGEPAAPASSESTSVEVSPEVEAIEDGMDARTAEIIEEEPRVSREEAEKIGEEVVEDSGVVANPADADLVAPEVEEAPVADIAPEAVSPIVEADADDEAARNTDIARSIIRSYEMQISNEAAEISTALARSEGRLEEFAMLGKTAERMIDSAKQTKDKFDAFLRNIDNYPFPAIQTRLQEIAASVQSDANGLRNVERGSGEEIRQILKDIKTASEAGKAELENANNRIEGHFNQHVSNSAELAADVPESLELNPAPTRVLEELNAVIEEVSPSFANEGLSGDDAVPLHTKLERIAGQMFDLVNQSRTRQIDSSDIFRLSEQLNTALTADVNGSGDLAESYGQRAVLSQRVAEAVSKARATLDTPFGRA